MHAHGKLYGRGRPHGPLIPVGNNPLLERVPGTVPAPCVPDPKRRPCSVSKYLPKEGQVF